MIDYQGPLSSSKSIVNRVLILEQAFESFSSVWHSEAQDVVLLDRALKTRQSEALFVGEGGTTFRFLSVFLSSQAGEWEIKAKPALLKRPQDDLYNFFESQNIDYKTVGDTLKLKSKGWNLSCPLVVSSEKTTQVLTAVLLTALRFKKNFNLLLKNNQESDYFLMTEELLKRLGLKLSKENNNIKFYFNNELSGVYEVEGDWSSAAFLYVLGALRGEVEITNLEEESLQPDRRVLKILKDSGADVKGFKVSSKNFKDYKSQKINLKESPDLFPVLSAFFAFSKGETKLFGAPQLIFKESNRISEIYKLLELCGYKVEKLSDGIIISGEGSEVLDHNEFDFDCSNDHRVFMCAYILKFMGYKINIVGGDSIKKSFPDFFDLEEKYVFSNRS